MNISMKKLWMSAAILVICGASVLTSCTNDDNPVVSIDEVDMQIQKMTLREKVGQLFYVRPECLDTAIHQELAVLFPGTTYTDRGQHDFDSFPLRSVPRKSKQEYN